MANFVASFKQDAGSVTVSWGFTIGAHAHWHNIYALAFGQTVHVVLESVYSLVHICK